MVKKPGKDSNFKGAAIRRPLAEEALHLLRKYPYLGPPRLSTLVDKLVQRWIEEAYVLVHHREAALGTGTLADLDEEGEEEVEPED